MRPFPHTIPLGEARAILEAAARPLARVERVELAALSHRVLAEDVIADADVPPFARAMMDGYAVQAGDTTGASRDDAARAVAGRPRLHRRGLPAGHVAAGACVEIATGAPLPAGADAVVMVEETQPGRHGPRRHRSPASSPGQHVGRAGADIARGATVLRGRRLAAAEPRRRAGGPGAHRRQRSWRGRAWRSSRPATKSWRRDGRWAPGRSTTSTATPWPAVVAAHGGVPVPLDVAGDTLEALDQAVDAALRCDVVVFSGGSSVGDRDLVLDVLRRRGAVAFHGIATRPGKPTAFGHMDGVPVFGMPGNPTSCLTNAYVLLAPFLRRVAGLPAGAATRRAGAADPADRLGVPAGTSSTRCGSAEGGAEPAFKASGDITSMAHADGYLEIAADVTAVEAGTMVDVVLF